MHCHPTPRRRLLLSGCVVLLAACGSESGPSIPTPQPVPAELTLLAGQWQSGTAGSHLAGRVTVQVLDDAGDPMPGVRVRFASDVPGVALEHPERESDATGRASSGVRLGLTLGEQVVRVDLPDVATVAPVTVAVTSLSQSARAIAGGRQLACTVLDDGRLGCWVPPRLPGDAARLRLAPTAERFTSVAVAIRRQFPTGTTMPGCATSEAGRVWCFEVSPTDGSITALAEKSGGYPAMGSVETGTSPTFADPPFCALGTAGAVWCWGRNTEGVLGDGTTTDRATPAPIAGGGTYRALTVGRTHACALATDDTAWCWGKNAIGQVGLPVAAVAAEPTLAGGGATFASLIALQQDATCGVRTAGGLACWGDPTIVQGAAAGTPAAPQAVVGVDGAVVAVAAGSATGWGDFFPSGERNSAVPLALTFPVTFAEVISGHTSELVCGRATSGGGIVCQHLRYANGTTASWTSPSPGFGIPAP